MMFIRTKDGIERALYGEDFHEGKSYFYKTEYQWLYGDTYHKVKTKTYAKNGITKIANTIEELCDEFVGIDNQGHYIIHNDEFIKGARIVPLEEVNYYGAIWTDKGLIYVAKMNDKGELELI